MSLLYKIKCKLGLAVYLEPSEPVGIQIRPQILSYLYSYKHRGYSHEF